MNIKKIILIVLVIQFFSHINLSSQRIYKVAANGSQDFTTLTAAIEEASDGDIIEICGIITNDGIVTHGIVVDKNLTIRGSSCEESFIQGSTIQLDERINKRIFTILEGVTVVLENVTIRNGYLHHSEMNDLGSAIKNHGILILRNCEVNQNYTELECGIQQGGIYNAGKGITAFDRWTPQNQKLIVSGF